MIHPAIATRYGGVCPDCEIPTARPGSRCRDCHAKSMIGKTPPDSRVVTEAAAFRGSQALLRRHLETGLHWLPERTRFEAACEIARSA